MTTTSFKLQRPAGFRTNWTGTTRSRRRLLLTRAARHPPTPVRSLSRYDYTTILLLFPLFIRLIVLLIRRRGSCAFDTRTFKRGGAHMPCTGIRDPHCSVTQLHMICNANVRKRRRRAAATAGRCHHGRPRRAYNNAILHIVFIAKCN